VAAGDDVWRQRRDAGQPAREPGLLHLSRYAYERAWAGVPTFMRLPMCLTAADLTAAGVDVAIVGAPMDSGGGQRGAARGPQAIRTAERYMPAPAESHRHSHVDVLPFEQLTVVDYGDAAVDPFDIHASIGPIRELVAEVVSAGAIPVVLGGDHTVLWPSAAACMEHHGASNVGLVHLDAHVDCMHEPLGHAVTHATPIRRLMDDEGLAGANVHQLGQRGFGPSRELRDWMLDAGITTHHMAEVERAGFQATADRLLRDVKAGPPCIYLSVDIDVLDPAFAPGTGTPEPGGLTPRELLQLVRRVCHETNVVGVDVVEVSPAHDPGYVTALTATRIVLEAITGIAMRRIGIEGDHHLDAAVSGGAGDVAR
jgi:agmatinase